jgi:hypothetical protein
MDCVNCKSNNSNTFFTEVMPCSHCNMENNIAYHACQSCGLIWKSIDNKIIEDIMFTDPNLGQFLNSSMSEIIHKCLHCGNIAFEIEPNLYHCPGCGFEWEVI